MHLRNTDSSDVYHHHNIARQYAQSWAPVSKIAYLDEDEELDDDELEEDELEEDDDELEEDEDEDEELRAYVIKTHHQTYTDRYS